jgi:hypothetical protein
VPRRPRAYRIDRCAGNGGRTLVANRWVRVYVKRDRLDNEYLRYCRVRTGSTVTLEASGPPVTELIPHYRIAGRHLGYAGINFDRKEPTAPGVDLIVAVRDVRKTYCVIGFRAQPPNSGFFRYDDRDPGVTDLELSSEGGIAWIVSGPPNRDDYFYVQKADAGGQDVLDEGPAIDTRSLAISGRRLFWLNGGVPRTALLEGRAPNQVCP